MFKESDSKIEAQIDTYIEKLNTGEKKDLLKGLEYFYAKKEAARLSVKKNKITMPQIVSIVRKIRVQNAKA